MLKRIYGTATVDLELYVHLYLPPQWDQGPKAASYDAYQDGSHVRLLLLEFIPPSFECVFSKYILLNGMHADAGLRPHVLQLADDSLYSRMSTPATLRSFRCHTVHL